MIERPAVALMLAALLAVAAGCSGDSPEAPYRNYLDRLGRSLEVATMPVAPPTLPRPPRVGKLRQPLPSDSLGTLDFLALTGCEVQVTIGKRNSSLGRLAPPSQRLLLDLEYLRLAPACIEHLKQDDRAALALTLEQAWQLKHEQLPLLIFNATLGGEEYRAFWRTHPTPGDFPAVDTATATRALGAVDQRVQQWLAGDYWADNTTFEIMLGEIAGGGGGRILRQLDMQARWLAAADAAIAAHMAIGPLCGANLRHTAADVLPVVVRRFFIEGIQPQAARLSSQYYQLLPPLTALESRLADALPDPYRQWMQQRDARLSWAAEAPRRHVGQVKNILSPCGTSPVPPG